MWIQEIHLKSVATVHNTSKENRKSQEEFECLSCGHQENAGVSASKNIEARGLRVFALKAKD